MLPCRTPTGTGFLEEWASPTAVTWQRFSRYDLNHSTEWLGNPIEKSLRMSLWWSTVSNAFARSRKTPPLTDPSSILFNTVSDKWASTTLVDIIERKPNCLGVRMSLSIRYLSTCIWTPLSSILLIVSRTNWPVIIGVASITRYKQRWHFTARSERREIAKIQGTIE